MEILTLDCSQLIGLLAESWIEFRPGKGQLCLITSERPTKDAKICNGPALKIAFAIAAQTQWLARMNLAFQLGCRLVSQSRNPFAIQIEAHACLLTAAIVGNHQVIPGSRLKLSQMLGRATIDFPSSPVSLIIGTRLLSSISQPRFLSSGFIWLAITKSSSF